MNTLLNETHDASLRSWIASANTGDSDFPIQNLPFALFRRRGSSEDWRGGVAIGDQVIDLAAVAAKALFGGEAARAVEAGSRDCLNALMALGPPAWSALRLSLSRALRADGDAAMQASLETCLLAQADAEYEVPARIGDYTDFYTSIHHATNIGRQFRPDNPLLPNYKWVPIGYHGRVSSIGISGQNFNRPMGQVLQAGASEPTLAPCARLDYELELGIFIGPGNRLGEPIELADAEAHVFGICLLNDWSARDIQAWEYQPLGPFLSKSFASTLSPWVVTMEALAPFRAPLARAADDPTPLPYLDSAENRASGAVDLQLEVSLQSDRMRAHNLPPQRLTHTSYRHAYWSLAQMVTHHTVNGCNLRPGDLFGSGTLSGPTLDQAGALIELTVGGKQALSLITGESRTYLEDGDAVTIRGWCERAGAVRIGFGECVGRVLPVRTLVA